MENASTTSTSPRSVCALKLLLALLLALPAYVLSDPAPAAAFEIDFGDWLQSPRPQLRTLGEFPSSGRDHLASAFYLAVERLRSHDTCRALFEDLGGDGETLFARSLYTRAKPHHETQICRTRVAAFTGVGSPVTRLCRSFRHLGAEQGALILLHEALHYAGLNEAPREAGAPSSREINQMVASSCEL